MKAKNITLGGISIAISMLILYLTTILPTNTLALLGISSCVIPIVIMRSNTKTAIMVYISTALLSFFIIPINYALMYILFFGVYGIMKFYIERLNKISFELILKFVFFNISLLLGITLFNSFLGSINITVPVWLLLLTSQFIFLIYDYALTGIITFYLKRFHNRI